MKRIFLIFVLHYFLVGFYFSCDKGNDIPTLEKRVDDMFVEMTLEEKLAQLYLIWGGRS